jgi:large subunit ribosomal protein L4
VSANLLLAPLRRDIIWEVTRWQRACRRQGTHKTKDRSEVFGSGKKARPQKGSGQARMGDPHSPHHIGGGQAFARRTSNYSYALPQHIINMGKRIALSAKYAEGNLYVIDAPTMSSASTQDFLHAMAANRWATFTCIHLDGELDPNLALACRANDHYQFLSDAEVNVFDVVKARRVIITRRAFEALEWRLAPANASKRTQENTMRWMVGSYGGGYTRKEIAFVK